MSQKMIFAFQRGDLVFGYGDEDDDRVVMVVDGLCQIRKPKKKRREHSRAPGFLLCDPHFPDWPPSPIQ